MGQYYQIEGIDALDALLSECYKDNAKMKRQMRKLMTDAIKKARADVSKAAASALGSDPRRARNAVRSSVYKALLGGQVNILNSKKAGAKKLIEPARTLRKGQRGGNRTERTERTENLMSYYGKDRGFILRFINAGTADRTSKYGNRGSISARSWFTPAAKQSMQQASEHFALLVDRAINEVWNSKD